MGSNLRELRRGARRRIDLEDPYQ
ncbi:MAG: hypothetical protein RL701_5860, partial [Pseudomonadota bacterium]